MGGIFGFLGLSDQAVLGKMCNVIKHRGSFVDFYLDNSVGFGIRSSYNSSKIRHDEKGKVWIAFDGEIYNRGEIIRLLEEQGHKFLTYSDAEVFTHLYENEKQRSIEKLRGKFAIAIFDAERNEITLARDRLGQSPMYYAFFNGIFLFSSEIKSILQYEEVPREVNLSALDYYLSLGHVPAPETMFKGIYKIPAANVLTYSQTGESSMFQYWNLKNPNSSCTFNEKCLIEEIYERLTESVRIRIKDSRDIGVLLSGGLDSGTIAALVKKPLAHPITAFSIAYENPFYDELDDIRKIVNYLGLEHYVDMIRPEDIDEKLIRRIVWLYDEPFANSAAMSSYFAFRLSSKYVPVVFTGDGGDEAFLGYQLVYWKEPKASIYYSKIPSLAKKVVTRLTGPLFRTLTKISDNRQFAIALDFLERKSMADPDPEIRFAARALARYFSPEQLNELYLEQTESRTQKNAYNLVKEIFRSAFNQNLVNRQNYAFIKLNLVADTHKVERASAAFSQEVRSPFLDHELMDFAISIPTFMKIRQGYTKYILRKVLSSYKLLPKEIVDSKKKRGLETPIENWLRKDLKSFVEEKLLEEKSPIMKYFDERYVRKIISERDRYSSTKTWTLLILAVWYNLYIQGENVFPTYG